MKVRPRVLLLSASSGAGHVRAAQALEKAFAARGDCDIEHIDAIHYVSKLFQRVYDQAYIAMARRAILRGSKECGRHAEGWRGHARRRTSPRTR